MPTLSLPTAEGRIEAYTTRPPRAFPKAEKPFNRVAFAAAHMVADPWPITTRGSTTPSTGTAPSPSASICGRSASAWRKPWTRPNAAWGSTGRARRN